MRRNLVANFVRIKVARIFNTLRSRNAIRMMRRAVLIFIVQALCGDPITIFGDGRQ